MTYNDELYDLDGDELGRMNSDDSKIDKDLAMAE